MRVIKRNISAAIRTLNAQNETHATSILIGEQALSLSKALETKSEEDWERLERLETSVPGQWEVLERMARGYSNKKIAHSLHIGYLTVESRVKRLYRNLGVTGQGTARTKAAILYLALQERKRQQVLGIISL